MDDLALREAFREPDGRRPSQLVFHIGPRLRELRRGDDDGEALRAREGDVEAVGVEHEGHAVGAAAGYRGGGRVVVEVGVGEGDDRDRRLLALGAVIVGSE